MRKLLSITVATLALVAYSPTAFSAFEGLSMMRMGDWEVDFSGNVNAFYTFVDCDGAGVGSPIIGGLACGSADGRDFDVKDVRTGLWPSWLNFYAVTETDSGIQTAVHLSFQPGVDGGNQTANGGIDGALGLNTSNFRQVFLTFGNDEIGTVKFGRDLGVFGSDAILNDMTLFGVGTVGGTTGGGNTSLGRIGVGYIYADWKAQVQYKTPEFKVLSGNASFTVAIIDPWAVSFSSEPMLPAPIPIQKQDKASFEIKSNISFQWNGVDFSLWDGFIYRRLGVLGRDERLNVFGVDIGAKVSYDPFSLVVYRYAGNGIGTTGFLRDAVGFIPVGGSELIPEPRRSDGYYVQVTAVIPDTGTKLGLSYGESNLELTGNEEILRKTGGATGNALGNLMKKNSSWVAGVYHPVGEALNLVAEYTNTEAEAQAGHKAKEDVFALGAIMQF